MQASNPNESIRASSALEQQDPAKVDTQSFFSCLSCCGGDKNSSQQKPESAANGSGSSVEQTAGKSKSLYDAICCCFSNNESTPPKEGSVLPSSASAPKEANDTPKKGVLDSFEGENIFMDCLPCYSGKEEKAQKNSDSGSSRTSGRPDESAAESGFLNDAVQSHSFTLAILNYAIHKRNHAMDDANAKNASMGDKVKYYATWVVAEATFLAAIPLAAIEAVVRFALSSIVFVVKSVACFGDENPSKNTLENLYHKHFSGGVIIQILAGHIAGSSLFENFHAKTALMSVNHRLPTQPRDTHPECIPVPNASGELY